MKISLPPALERFVVEKVHEGLYQSESEVIADALRRFHESLHVERLRAQLASVDIQIKIVMNQIEAKRLQEEETKQRIAEAQEATEAIAENLQKAADAYSRLLESTSLL
jgi:putative addiction module CopG family antidote